MWNSSAELIDAYHIGRAAANAALNLLNAVPPSVTSELAELVQYLGLIAKRLLNDCLPCLFCELLSRQFTMHKFLTHEAIAAGCFNVGECCASATQSAWHESLTLTESNIQLLVCRLSSDYSRVAAKMRKVWTSKEIDTMMHHHFFWKRWLRFFSPSSYI